MTDVGKGTTYTVYLPSMDEVNPERSSIDVGELEFGRGETILVVEDDPSTRSAVGDALLALNYQVLEAANGREALTRIEDFEETIALVLSDLVMPDMGGQALSRALENRRWPGRMIVMSGHPLDENRKANFGTCVVERLQKPISMERLAQAVAEALRTA